MTHVRAEVWGDPIAHSRSPDLHHAAYTVLGIPAEYAQREVNASSLAGTFRDLSNQLTGISLTMPLKTAVLDIMSDHRGPTDILGAANTAVSDGDSWWLDNTDPLGVAAMLRQLLTDLTAPVTLLGAGATAKAVVWGLGLAGWRGRLSIVVREVGRATELVNLASSRDIDAHVFPLSDPGDLSDSSLTISTLPSGTVLSEESTPALLASGSTLMDVGYHPWPTPLAGVWQQRGLPVHSGLPMLMFQALGQIRAFINRDSNRAFPNEGDILEAMAQSVSLDPVWANPTLMGE